MKELGGNFRSYVCKLFRPGGVMCQFPQGVIEVFPKPEF